MTIQGMYSTFQAVFMCFSPSLRLGSGGEGGVKRDWYTTCLCIFSAYTAQRLFLVWDSQNPGGGGAIILPPPREVLEWPYTIGGGGIPPPPLGPPSPDQSDCGGKKMKHTVGKIWSGHFWYTNFWVPDPPSPPSSLLIHPWLPPPTPVSRS